MLTMTQRSRDPMYDRVSARAHRPRRRGRATRTAGYGYGGRTPYVYVRSPPFQWRLRRPTLVDVAGPEPIVPEPARSDRPSGSATSTEGPALRDARAISARIASDEKEADDARRRYEDVGLPTLDIDERFAALRQPNEVPHVIHSSALLELGSTTQAVTELLGGALYLTSRRLVHLGMRLTEVPLANIAEMAVALERLLLIRLNDGSDLALEVDHPRLLRMQIAAALGAGRATRR